MFGTINRSYGALAGKGGRLENKELGNIGTGDKIKITNNFDKEAVVTKGEGIGLNNVINRLSLVYSRQDLLDTSIHDNLFKVEITVPQI